MEIMKRRAMTEQECQEVKMKQEIGYVDEGEIVPNKDLFSDDDLEGEKLYGESI